MENEKLIDEQIENWRKILFISLGAYAFIMPKEEVQALRDTMQKYIDNESENYISKTLSGITDKEEPVIKHSKNETTFGDLLKEARERSK